MLSRLISKLTYANVVATLALFLALGGGLAWALANNSVKSKHIKDGQVKSSDLNDAAEGVAFSYAANTGNDLQVEILDVGGYVITAGCENVGGQPSVEFFMDFPEDGRLAGHGVQDGPGPGVPSSGNGVEVQADTPFDGGALTATASESATLGATFSYVGQTQGATVNLHALADDDSEVCRLNGMLIPGIIPPA